MKKINKIIDKIKTIDKFYIAIFLMALFILSPYISTNFHIGDDSAYHIFNSVPLESSWNLINTLQIKILPITCNTFGWGGSIFYPQLSHFIIAFFYKIFKFSNLNIIISVKIFLFLVILSSGIFMYKLLLKLTKNRNASFVGAIFYITAPYFMSDIFVRGAYAEGLFFSFLPMPFLSISYLYEKNYRKFYAYFVIGYVGLINSHLVMAVYVTIFIIGILILNIKKNIKKDIIINFIIASIIVLSICMPYIIPLLQHKFLGNYAVFKLGYMSSIDDILKQRLHIYDLFSFPKYYISYGLNLFSVLLFCITCYKYKNLKNEHNTWILRGSIIMGIISFIMITEFFPWRIMPNFLRFIQFPWRLEILLIFFTILISSFSILLFEQKLQSIIVIICTISCLFYVNELLSKLSFEDPKSFITTTAAERAGYEYYPVNAMENIDYIDSRSADILLLKGKAKIKVIKDDTPYLKFKVSDISKKATLELPRIYYLGYRIIEKDNKGNIHKLKYEEDKYGMMKIDVSKNSIIIVDYVGTKLANIGNVISIITMIGFIGYLIFYKKKKNSI